MDAVPQVQPRRAVGLSAVDADGRTPL